MKKAPLVAVAAVLLLTLAGCAGTPESPAAEPTAPAAATPTPPAETTPTEAPTGPVEVTTAPTPTPDTNAEALKWLSGTTRWFGTKGITLTEDQVRAAADYGCEQLESGADPASVQPLTGDVAPEVVSVFVDNLSYYCPIR